MPKKVLVSTVELFWKASRAGDTGLCGAESLSLDWSRIIDRKHRLVADWGEGKEASLEKQGISVLRGRATFTGPHTLAIGDRTVEAQRVILATGSSPGRPPIPGVEHAITSNELLDLREFPARLVVIGGGVIAMEFAFVFARAGAQVTVIEAMPTILGGMDAEMRELLEASGREAGIVIETGPKIVRIGADRTVDSEVGRTVRTYTGDQVLLAVGRPPNTGGLGLFRPRSSRSRRCRRSA